VKVLVVHAHPQADSLGAALSRTAVEALQSAGHDVVALDLYGIGFQAAMTAAERERYESDDPVVDPQVAEHITAIRAAEALVFVYPTWWSTVPAVLKGWLERTMVPGVGFSLDPRSNKVRPALTRVRHIVGISTYGSPRPYVAAINDNGRRLLLRALRLSTGWRTRTTWLALYAVDTATPDERDEFIARVATAMRALR
jgi:NAD(P)H dehydrogenase (quinone)